MYNCGSVDGTSSVMRMTLLMGAVRCTDGSGTVWHLCSENDPYEPYWLDSADDWPDRDLVTQIHGGSAWRLCMEALCMEALHGDSEWRLCMEAPHGGSAWRLRMGAPLTAEGTVSSCIFGA